MYDTRDRNNGWTIRLLVSLLAVRSATAGQNVTVVDGPFPDNVTSDAAVDVQYASCKIITDRIVATAEGKFSRFCHGVCNTNETNAILRRIETLLTTDADNVKSRLLQLERASVGHVGERQTTDTGRLREIGAYNGTAFTAGGNGTSSRMFVYYWRVDAFWRLTFADGRALSPPFYVSARGYRIALAVHSDPATRTVRVAAVLATGGEYDARLAWPFAHRLRLSVLDQTDVAPQDVVSRVWDDVRCGRRDGDNDVCASMEFRHDVLTDRRYVAGDVLLVKVTVFFR